MKLDLGNAQRGDGLDLPGQGIDEDADANPGRGQGLQGFKSLATLEADVCCGIEPGVGLGQGQGLCAGFNGKYLFGAAQHGRGKTESAAIAKHI